MEIAEFLILGGKVLIAFGLIILVFVGVMWYMNRQEAYQLHKELGHVAHDLAANKLIALTIEIDGDQFLCYNYRTMDFVCQGRSLTEIAEKFKLRFPDKAAAIYNGDESALTILKQQLKDLHETGNSIGSAS